MACMNLLQEDGAAHVRLLFTPLLNDRPTDLLNREKKVKIAQFVYSRKKLALYRNCTNIKGLTADC